MGFIFSDAKIDHAVDKFKFKLVLKFLSKRPPIDTLRTQIIKSLGFREVHIISFMDKFHILLHLTNEKNICKHGLGKGEWLGADNFNFLTSWWISTLKGAIGSGPLNFSSSITFDDVPHGLPSTIGYKICKVFKSI